MTPTRLVTLKNGGYLDLAYDGSTSTLVFTAYLADSSNVSIGFGKTMVDAEII